MTTILLKYKCGCSRIEYYARKPSKQELQQAVKYALTIPCSKCNKEIVEYEVLSTEKKQSIPVAR